jgi:glutathione reductase (NADPH)
MNLTMAGLTEAKAREQGLEMEVHARDMDDYQAVRREGHQKSGAAFKIVIDRGTRRVVGAHIFGPDAHEVINLFALTIRLGLKAEDLGKLLSAYPFALSNIANMLS